MNARRNPPPRPLAPRATAPSRHARRGTVIVVVIALLGALMLLGFLFLTLTMQEEANSQNFGETHDLPAEKDPDVFFNWALEQLIVGPPDTARNSVLFSGYKSLLPNMVGADLAPYDGTGVGTAWSGANGRPELDLNRNGVVDLDEGLDPAKQFALQLNFAPGSQLDPLDYTALRNPSVNLLPAPDADFTYPDLNSAFLSYDWIEPVTGRRVVIPSFHRPQLLRNRIAAGDYLLDPGSEWTDVGGTPVHPWYTSTETLPFVMRPHLERRVVATDPENPTNFSVRFEDAGYARRFVTGNWPDVDGSGPVASDDPSFVPPISLAVHREPIWRVGIGDAAAVAAGTDTAAYANSYDADPDNDGIFDAIWLDLDFPIQNAGDGVGEFVPLWALKVVDVDALFNLNAHGNSYGSYADADGDSVDDSLNLLGDRFIGSTNAAPPLSQSGSGLMTQDGVNAQYGLAGLGNTNIDPLSDEAKAVKAFSEFYDRARDTDTPWTGGAAQSRNLEWWFLLHGRVTFRDSPGGGGGRVPDDLLVGRYGEPDRLEEGAMVLGTGDPTAAAFFPYPGLTANSYNVGGAGDDNSNALEGLGRQLPGLAFGGARGYGAGATHTMTIAPEGVPLDRRGSGFATDALRGLQGLFLTDTNPIPNDGRTLPDGLEDGNVRFRFPTLMNAVLPLFDVSANQGFNNSATVGAVGAFAYVRNWFAGTGLHEGRIFANRAYAVAMNAAGEPTQGTVTAELTGQGAAAGSMVEPTSGNAGAAPTGRWAASLYGAAAGQMNNFEQYHRLQIDEPAETIRDFDLAQSQSSDQIFSPAETARLHMTDADYRIGKTTSRLLTLAPVSFAKAPEHERVRRRFTSVSWDVATTASRFEPPVAALQSPGASERAWEHNRLPSAAATDPRQFPPVFGNVAAFDQNDPFRAPVRSILGQAVMNAEPTTLDGKRDLRRLMRKLSFNLVAERVTNPADPAFDRTAGTNGHGEVRLRTLTPHPLNLAATEVIGPAGHPAFADYTGTTNTTPRFGVMEDNPIPSDGVTRVNLRAAGGGAGTGLLTWDFGGLSGQSALRAQEWHARRDRQNLARDIYVLLYTVGGVDPATPNKNYTGDNSAHALYSEEQLREMAQLAVNIVDAMDPDPVRTLFVYDKNLGNGYTPFDDGYANRPDPADNERGVVAGVERQELALSEVLANVSWAEDGTDGDGDPANHTLTEWNDAGKDETPHDFLFVELAYTGPGELNFAGGNPAINGGAPGENVRIVVRDPRNDRQFREDDGLVGTPAMSARAIIPRAGKLTAARPFYTVANADAYNDGSTYVDTMTYNAANARSRMRVNLNEQRSAPSGVDGVNWITLAPQPFADNARQVDPASVLRDTNSGNNAQILDTLAPGDTANPTFRVQHLNNDLTVTALANPATADANDLFHLNPPTAEDWYADADATPAVEVLLQVRLNPLRQPKAADPADPNYGTEDRDNPWVTVDRTRVVTTRLDLFVGDDNDADPSANPGSGAFEAHFTDGGAVAGPISAAGGTNDTPKLASRVRMEPLLRASELAAVGRTNAERSLFDGANPSPRNAEYGSFVFNSLGGHDRNSPGGHAGEMRPFALWQPHYDREFAGPADVIGVPLYDAESLTGLTAESDRAFGSGASAIKKTTFQEFSTLGSNALRQIGLGYDPDPQDFTGQTGVGHDAVLNEFAVAGSRLLYPDVARPSWQDPVYGGDGASTTQFNAWYRLLQYVGTPRRLAEMTDAVAETVAVGPTDRLNQDGTFDLGEYRLPGRINLNTLRHPQVLAGVMDDSRVHGSPSFFGLPAAPGSPTPAGTSGVTDLGGNSFNEDFYRSLLLSRDGRDPLTLPPDWGGVRAVLPGLAARGMGAAGGLDGNPFTGFHGPTGSLTDPKNLRGAIQSTPLRLRPQADAWVGGTGVALNGRTDRTSDNLPRAFFGVGGSQINHATDETGRNPADLDFTTRYRLLNKVLNSATHRSNVFLCWIQVDFFHARELTGEEIGLTGAEANQRLVRIGAKRGDSPRYRGVFLIDRSKAPALLRADHLPETSDAGLNTYSFAREPLSGGAKFPWQELILHRQRIQ
ncbi:hypothetical protein [Alienimonas californiensis]|uniref:Uncharacterized protein n=1 Tax=Alienimonas californiensis TaxID=2527989 RepID=A0A517P7J7_9PLAN|nr:hypothetical protein [Alienimonas californiensis]QDT15357.1 hypothetical protein CA12_14420 [Alienimonas californiensis]